jgi:hypothetical protein
MNSTSPMQTATVGAVTGAVLTLISAFVKHYNIDLSVAVGVVAAAHWAGQQIAARSAAKTPATPAQ